MSDDLPATTRARLDWLIANAEHHASPQPLDDTVVVNVAELRALRDAYDVLRAAQAQAAPVLAAAERIVDARDISQLAKAVGTLKTAVAAWRAAREG